MKLYSHHGFIALALLLAAPWPTNAFAATAAVSPPAPVRTSIPARFEHQRIFVTPRLASGAAIDFYTDTGGGLNTIREDVAQRLGLSPGADVEEEGHPPVKTVAWPAFVEDASIPPAEHDRFLQGRLAIAPTAGSEGRPLTHEGFLGSRWFAGRVWEFDYPAGALHVLEGWTPPASARSTAMTMLPKSNMYWPRIQVEIDGEQLNMLFDTGAQVQLGTDGAQALGLEEGTQVAGSFITARQYRKWRDAHPDWPVAKKGDIGMPMIQVANVRIAGTDTGPVWFAARPDRNFTELMSSMTDAPVEGAIGGSAFARLKMVADYPAQMLYVLP